ncbi:MAG: glycosyltransferase family 1 protein [Deltaproteobacteria bacterium]|nr:glycosyltransferase family 1 protein [Deltaproteobacteria bacterium]
MRVVSDFAGDYKDGYNSSLNIEEFSNDDVDTVFFYGIQCGIDKKLLDLHKHYRRKILLDLWSPCAFFTNPGHFNIINGFDEIYSICPFTSQWTNTQVGKKLMKYAFYPVNPQSIKPDSFNKLFDVVYAGSIISYEHIKMIDTISNFKYIFVTQDKTNKATHINISNALKINLTAQSKIGIVLNKLYLSNEHFINLQKYDGWGNNIAFNHVVDYAGNKSLIKWQLKRVIQHLGNLKLERIYNQFFNPVAPQIKSRIHELALCKTLILCQRDLWNLIEDYYLPGKEFIYFDSIDDLNTIIPAILDEYDSYKDVIENAYKKARCFTTGNLVALIQSGNEFSRNYSDTFLTQGCPINT